MNETILLVDDEPVLLQASREMLKQGGYKVIPASSAKQGIEILATRDEIDLVITDHIMPDVTGLEFAEYLFMKGYDIPVILMSSELTEKIMDEGKRAGVRGFLDRPYSNMTLCGMAKSVLSAVNS